MKEIELAAKTFNFAMSQMPCPHRGVIIEFGHDGTHYTLRLSLENLHDFPEQKRQDIHVWAFRFVDYMTKIGCPTVVEIE